MKNNENPKFDVLNAISILSQKLAKSKLKVKRTQEFTKAEDNLNAYFGTTSGGTWMLCAMISYYFDNEGDVLLYAYTDYLGNCGMMSKDLQKLTPAIYSHIEAVRGKKDVFLCRFDECDEKHRSDEDDVCYYGVGELRNSKGEKIE